MKSCSRRKVNISSKLEDTASDYFACLHFTGKIFPFRSNGVKSSRSIALFRRKHCSHFWEKQIHRQQCPQRPALRWGVARGRTH